MPRIKDASIEAVRQNADFVAVVEERTALRKAGARLTGRCPFHEERTPSFSVNPVEKLYHCFGCGVGGDMIKFVRETQGLDFTDAVEWLAERFRIPIEYEESDPGDDARRNRRRRLYELLDQAATFYERYLWDSQAGSLARDYLAGRGLREEVCREFRLGLALGGTTLARKAAVLPSLADFEPAEPCEGVRRLARGEAEPLAGAAAAGAGAGQIGRAHV